MNKPRTRDPFAHDQDAIRQLCDCMRQGVALLQQQLQRRPRAVPYASEKTLVRALLLSGNGDKFDPAINVAIDKYVALQREIDRYAKMLDLPDEVRADILATFGSLLDESRIELRELAVTIEEVEEGSPLDSQLHFVNGKRATDDCELLHTVCRCVSPLFRWTNGLGKPRYRQARVVAYTTLAKPSPAVRNIQPDAKEGDE